MIFTVVIDGKTVEIPNDLVKAIDAYVHIHNAKHKNAFEL